MGLLDDAASAISGRPPSHSSHKHKHRHSHHSRSHRSRSSSPERGLASLLGGDKHHKHNSSRSSFFSLPNVSRSSSFFGLSRPSYYKRSPRQGFVHRTVRRLRRLLRDLVYYAKRHPVRVFMLVVMPLVTGGALTALLALFGLRLPRAVEQMLGLAARAGSGDSIGLVGEAVRMVGGNSSGPREVSVRRSGGWGGDDEGMYWERRSRSSSVGYDGDHGGWTDGWKGVSKFFS